MSSQTEDQTLFCELCGTPVQGRAGENECLNCLLTAGIEPGDEESFSILDEPHPRFFQHYEILSRPDGTPWELGRGGMGVTYKARDVNLDTPVALKVINARFSAHATVRQQFLREAQAAARLRHPNVASVFHFGVVNRLPSADVSTPGETAEEGDCFYAMEFIEGETLQARLRRAGPLTPMEALEIGIQVARALAAAEKRGLVHRDLKPSNIMLATEAGSTGVNGSPYPAGEVWVKVIDFGLAKFVDKVEQPSRFLGTLAFASPEQIGGGAVDARSDIYSLGATLWYALSGEIPYTVVSPRNRANPDQTSTLKTDQLAEHGVPRSVITLLASALAQNPVDRPASPAVFGQTMQDCLDALTGVGRAVVARSPQRFSRWAAAAGFAAAAVLISAMIFLDDGSPPVEDKSIAVLPFRNLTGNAANAFLAEGIEDDILARLVKIRDLKVISHLSSARYPANARRDLSAIGRSLGVRHVLEGSFDRIGNQISLQVGLVDTSDGRQLWARHYKRPLADVINLQGELASAIARALDATLSPQERIDVQARSTGNPDAYVLYLRGRKFDNSPTIAIGDYEAAAALYKQAIALDPGFALAHSRLGATLAFLYRFRGPSEELKQQAYAQIAEALRLNPNLGEAHLDKGLCLYRLDRDLEGALPELETARELLPNDTEGQSFVAYINRRRGNWRKALSILQEIRQRDPRNSMYAEELYTTSYLLRDWGGARRYINEAKAIQPNLLPYQVQAALVDLWQNGDLRPMQRVFSDLKGFGDPEGSITWLRWDAAMITRDFAAAQAAIDSFPGDTLPSVYAAPLPKSYMQGCIALAQGDNGRAQQLFETARPAMEAESIAHPEDALRHGRLGLLYAYMGRKGDAIREGERAAALIPIETDHFDGPLQLANLALIHAWVGDSDRAISMIESLLRTPGAVFFAESSITLPELRLRWQWSPLRKDPRFQKILSAPEPQTEY
jgi:serine/threonine protein kinase/tetratricopeptide (TPR) repeat protein